MVLLWILLRIEGMARLHASINGHLVASGIYRREPQFSLAAAVPAAREVVARTGQRGPFFLEDKGPAI